MKTLFNTLLFIGLCAADLLAQGRVTGISFDPVPDKATVIIYRRLETNQWTTNFVIRANGEAVCRLSNNRYVVYKTKPGQVDFTTVAGGLQIPDKDLLPLDLQAGKVYFLQADVLTRFGSNKLILSEVTQSTAQRNLPGTLPDRCMKKLEPVDGIARQ
jgi:hypothetical protein